MHLEPASPAASPPVTQQPPPTATATTVSPAPLDPKAAATLARARKLLADGKADAAQAEFIHAIGSGTGLNKGPLVELAYLQLRQNMGADEDIEAELLTGATDGDPELEAQAWYNLAVLYSRLRHRQATIHTDARRPSP